MTATHSPTRRARAAAWSGALEAPLDVRIPILNVPGNPASGERDASTGDGARRA